MQNDLKKRKGFINFSKHIFSENRTEDFFKAIYSEFFPVFTQENYDIGFGEKIRMYGYSKHFKEIEIYEETPEYIITLEIDEKGNNKFAGIKIVE